MSTVYNGLPGNEARKGSLVVSGATNATPIVVTTTAAHGLVTGELAQIVGVQGNVNANGVYYVGVINSTQFGLYVTFTGGAPATPVAGSGAYTVGGAVVPLTWNASSTLPDDGDSLNAASVNTPFEGNFDRESWLLSRLGSGQIMSIQRDATGLAPAGLWGGQAFVTGVWGAVLFNFTAAYGGVIHAAPGDTVEVRFTGSMNPTVACAVRPVVSFANYDGTGAAVVSNGAGVNVPVLGLGCPVQLSHLATNSASNGRQVFVSLQYQGVAAPGAVQWDGDAVMITTVYRST